MNRKLELAARKRDARLQKNDDELENHLHYVSLLEMVVGDSPAANAERLGYARMAAQHAGPIEFGRMLSIPRKVAMLTRKESR